MLLLNQRETRATFSTHACSFMCISKSVSSARLCFEMKSLSHSHRLVIGTCNYQTVVDKENQWNNEQQQKKNWWRLRQDILAVRSKQTFFLKEGTRSVKTGRNKNICRLFFSFFFTQNRQSHFFQSVNNCLGVGEKKQWRTQRDQCNRALHHSPYFEKSLQVVNLSECHCHENQSFEERPQHHSAVRVVVD